MKRETVRGIQKQMRNLLPVVEQMHTIHNRPLIGMCGVLIQNAQFNSEGCVNSSLKSDEEKIKNIHKVIGMLAKNNQNDFFIAWLWEEVDCIITGYIMSEDLEETLS